jgi:hypothetical protein
VSEGDKVAQCSYEEANVAPAIPATPAPAPAPAPAPLHSLRTLHRDESCGIVGGAVPSGEGPQYLCAAWAAIAALARLTPRLNPQPHTELPPCPRCPSPHC